MGTIRIDDRAILEKLESLRKPEVANIVLAALEKGGALIQAETKSQLKSFLGPGATSTRHWNKPMLSGILNIVDEGYMEVRVSLYGIFRLKFFEMGTKDRKLRRTGAKDHSRGRTKGDKRYLYRKSGKENFYRAGTSRGRIKALNFFQNAREKEENRAMEVIKDELTKRLQNYLR